MFFATKGKYKAVMASRMASLLAWSAIHHGDRVGGVIFSDDSHHELKPQRGKTGALRMINNLVKHPSWRSSAAVVRDKTAGMRSLVRLRRLARPGSMIFMMSDFRNLDDKMESQLILLSRHTDVVMVLIYDQLEQALPSAGLYRVSNGEEEIMLDTYDHQRLESYRAHFVTHRQRP